MKTLTFCGVVTSGKGEGKKYLALPWVRNQIEKKLGFTAYEGTLNLNLSQKSSKLRTELKIAESLQICPLKGYCVGTVFRSKIGTLECAIIIPSIETYPKNLLEIVAYEKLRQKLDLKDGDTVKVKVNF